METHKVSKFQIQTPNIKHSIRQPENAQRNIVDSQLTGQTVQPGFDTTNIMTCLVAMMSLPVSRLIRLTIV